MKQKITTMTDLRFIKTFGLVLIGIALVLSVSTALYITANPEIMLNTRSTYLSGVIGGTAIGLALSGALLRLYSATNS
jgi:hypothetical protein